MTGRPLTRCCCQECIRNDKPAWRLEFCALRLKARGQRTFSEPTAFLGNNARAFSHRALWGIKIMRMTGAS
jgi:hypothetical protein